MIARFFRRGSERRRTIEGLHLRIIAASRAPALYERLGVPDTVEGRFECLVLHTVLVLRRLNRLPPPAADVAQDLVNSVFLQLDASLRELGIGDFGVPKRMKKLGAAFYGRAGGYDAALDARDGDALRLALARNVLGADEAAATPEAAGLAAYVMAADAALDGSDLDRLLAGTLDLPDPAGFAADAGEKA
ncbi:ubiquinol-cytochrome C chaperone family protein [Methylobacterium dankookense]|uniref:Ubiquinol-cytochrome c chaperone domain-containing protein n=1 Tax=Methylobacterium dankookense TaxID=560405 RepID=A0A564FRB5_9HYPH|nr:ubiquinol-cytochrome C chaperone family protein [Methylobacterium dankookense]GJD58098.1 hypothetical protein IFDJLNFL_4013 [Methylobacterium dankookense]VUF10477.1 hypothetical protein MTDSW087_00144 [Methylobacterium dankookense]